MRDPAAPVILESLRSKLKLKNLEEKQLVFNKHKHIDQSLLSKAFDVKRIREHSAKLIGAGALTTGLLVSSRILCSRPGPSS